MKKISIYLTWILLLIYIIMFKIVIVSKYLRYLDYINILFFGILFLIIYLIYGFPKDKKIINYSAMQSTIIIVISYFVIIYVLGLFFGFSSTMYSLKFLNIINNIFFISLYYIFRELYRYLVLKQINDKRNKIFIVTILFIFLDIIMQINNYDLSSGVRVFEFIEACVLPNIAINMLLSYTSLNFNYKIGLIIILLLKIPNYFLPIFPNLGNYFGSVILIVMLFCLYYQYSLILEKYQKKMSVKKTKIKKYSLFLILGPTLLVVGVISGLFKYHLFAIVSNSMLPVFARGDAVLVEKLVDNEFQELEIGDIIAFYNDEKMIVHRIIQIDKNNEMFFIKTKGDNNETMDYWTLSNDDIYGKVIFSIKYIGIPSIEISEMFNSR